MAFKVNLKWSKPQTQIPTGHADWKDIIAESNVQSQISFCDPPALLQSKRPQIEVTGLNLVIRDRQEGSDCLLSGLVLTGVGYIYNCGFGVRVH